MNFVDHVKNMTLTENGAVAYKSTNLPTLDFFYAAGASRGKDIVPLFSKAFTCSQEDAVRIALWMRDVRGGAGERKAFRDILQHVEEKDIELFKRMAAKIPLLGRWDDMLVAKTADGFAFVAELIRRGIAEEAGAGDRSLAAKWMPREGAIAKKLREAWKKNPKSYRKFLVRNTKVVETQMAADRWSEIEFQEVPSLAIARYNKAFERHVPEEYGVFLEKVVAGTAKVNAGAVYPYDIIKAMRQSPSNLLLEEQWKALPDFLNGQRILPMVDVSGSMMVPAGEDSTIKCLDVAVSLGLYISGRQKGPFKDLVLTFSERPAFVSFEDKATLFEKYTKMCKMPWGGNTNICAAFDLILAAAKESKATTEDMPRMLIIFSDMEFDCATHSSKNSVSIYRAYEDKFQKAGYEKPIVVFWNIRSRHGHAPVKFNETGTILVSGFSPSLMKSIIGDDPAEITPVKMMRDVIGSERYSF